MAEPKPSDSVAATIHRGDIDLLRKALALAVAFSDIVLSETDSGVRMTPAELAKCLGELIDAAGIAGIGDEDYMLMRSLDQSIRDQPAGSINQDWRNTEHD